MIKLASNIFYAFCSRGINFVVPLLIMPYMINLYGIEAFGDYFYAQALLQPFALFSDFGFNVTAVKMVANSNQLITQRNKIVSIVLKTKLILTLVCLLIFFFMCYSGILSFKFSNLLFFVLLSSILQINQPTWFFQGIEKNRTFTIINLIVKVILIVSIFFFATKDKGVEVIPFLEFISYFISLVISIGVMYYFEAFNFVKTKFKEYRHFFIESFNIALISFFNWGAVSGTAIILRSSVSIIDYGLFSAFARIIYYGFAIFQPVNQSLQPFFSKKFNSSFEKTLPLFRKSVLLLVLLLLLFIASFLFFLPLINKILLGNASSLVEKNDHYYIYIVLMITRVGFVILNSFIAIQFYVSNNLTNIYRNLYILNTVISIGLAYYLIIHNKGLTGFASGLLTGEVIYALALLLFSNKKVRSCFS